MKDIFKINSVRVYSMWLNVTYGLVDLILVLLLTYILPTYLAPIVSAGGAFAIYLLAYNEKSRRLNCVLHPAAIFLTLIAYTFILLILNILDLWVTSVNVLYEMIFFTEPFVPMLIMAPVLFITSLLFLIRRQNNNVCTDCQLLNGHFAHRGQMGLILHHESKVEMKNLVIISGILTLTTWIYFLLFYNPVNMTSRDLFVFLWLPIILMILDVFYFVVHYYDIYLDLREHNMVISPQEMAEMPMKTWVRYYVICEDSMYLNMHAKDEVNDHTDRTVVETPFIVSTATDGISENEAASIIRSLTGVKDGELKFFFGRKSADNFKHNIVRFFYFLPGEVEEYPHLKDVAGTWISSNKFKTLRYTNPDIHLSSLLSIDMTRLATIMITSKTFNEKGERRTKLKQYHPSFNFEELKHTKIDFQDNAWLRVSVFNSNTPYYKFRRFWRNLTRGNKIPVDEQ